MLEIMEKLYRAELALCVMYFDLFRRFPMIEDSELYFREALFYSTAATETFKGLGEMAELFNHIEAHIGKEGLEQLCNLVDAEQF